MRLLIFFSVLFLGYFWSINPLLKAQEEHSKNAPTETAPSETTPNTEPISPPEKQQVLELTQHFGDYLGYGIGVHASDVSFPSAFEELAPKFVRMEFGPRWDVLEEQIPSGKSVEEYYAYLQRNYNGDSPNRRHGAQYTHKFLRQQGIEIIKIHFELPYYWRAKDGSQRFLSEHIEDLARFHTAHLRYLYKSGVHVDYMELSNEPDGEWNGHIPPKDYARLLRRCRELFTKHGFEKVKILGPGLTFLNLHNTPPPYFEAIKEVGTEHLHGWSTHVWDEAEFTSSRPEYTYGIWQPFLDQIKKLDPERQKPLFVTEYASDITDFGDKSWVSPRDRTTDTVVDTWHHAVRVIANSITHLNRGSNALVVYRLSDTHWHKTGWGLMTPGEAPAFKPKPVYHALIHSLKTLPIGGHVLHPTWYLHDDPITLSALHLASKNELHLLLANSTETTQVKEIPLSPNLTGLTTADIDTMVESGSSDATKVSIDIENALIRIEMPPISIARIRFNLGEN